MSIESKKGSEWRRWDLHVHTKGTNKNDQFTSPDFETFCSTMFRKAIDCKIAAIGITDYFSVNNYKKVLDFVTNIDRRTEFTDDDKGIIREILLLPNVELRMLPVTEQGRLVNIHCIFNPAYVSSLENDFFGSIDYSIGGGRKVKMNRQGMIDLGKSLTSSLDDDAAYKKGVENFVVTHDSLQELLGNPKFSENTIVAISNSSTDGASGLQKHYDFFEGTEPGSLEAVRKSLYCLSQFIFSSNVKDRKYFLGLKVDDEDKVKEKCGSLKPCVHGCDAHTEAKLFAPDENRYCWIKADVTFEGLKQTIYEPADRVFVGAEPPVIERVRENKTKYINSVAIKQKDGYDKAQGVWFDNVHIDLNKELVAIIGNKGSGKSALSDVMGVMGNTHNAGVRHENLSFLNGRVLKFRKKGYAENFEAELTWEDGTGNNDFLPLNHDVDVNQIEKVKYLPQNYFENLTNDLEGEGFDRTLKSVIFLHIPEEQRLESRTFEELESIKAKSIDVDLLDLRDEVHQISEDVIKLESKKHPSHVQQLESSIEEKKRELAEHEKNKPTAVPDPSKDGSPETQAAKSKQYTQLEALNTENQTLTENVSDARAKLNKATKEKEELTQLDDSLARLEAQFNSYKAANKEVFEKYGLNIDDVAKANFDKKAIGKKKQEKIEEIKSISASLRTKAQINNNPELAGKTAELKAAHTASFVSKQEDVLSQIAAIKNLLSQPEKLYQDYKEKLGKWEKRKSEIEGDETRLNSLKFFENERKYINDKLPAALKARRAERLAKTLEIFAKQKEVIELYKTFKKSIDDEIAKDEEFTKKFKMVIDVNFKLDSDFAASFLQYINKSKKGTFYGTDERKVDELLSEMDLLSEGDVSTILNTTIEWLEIDQRENEKLEAREISDQVYKVQDFYDFLFSLQYLKPTYELKLDGKILDELSPGEKGTLLLVFYLMIDKEDTPLIIDQPEDNLDNKSVFQVLTHFIKSAKKRRQIVIVTHNPNLAVGADAEQVIYVELDKKDSHNTFSFEVGAIENPVINKRLVEILEGTMPAFDKRKLRYKDQS